MMDILEVDKIRGIELVATLVRDKDHNQGNWGWQRGEKIEK